jgi:dephospho-CoA kinase
MVRIIGITGKSGSGKTHLCRLLEQQGYQTESADEFNRSLLAKDQVLTQLENVLQENIRNAAGYVDKRKLMSFVFSDKTKKKQIEKILHPLIYDELFQKIQQEKEEKWVFFEGALLCEKKQNDFLSASVLVLCPKEVCFQRLLGGRQLPVWIANALLTIQTPDDLKVKNVTHQFSGVSSKLESVKQLIENLTDYFAQRNK